MEAYDYVFLILALLICIKYHKALRRLAEPLFAPFVKFLNFVNRLSWKKQHAYIKTSLERALTKKDRLDIVNRVLTNHWYYPNLNKFDYLLMLEHLSDVKHLYEIHDVLLRRLEDCDNITEEDISFIYSKYKHLGVRDFDILADFLSSRIKVTSKTP